LKTIETSDPVRSVRNQPPPLQPINLFEADIALCEALARFRRRSQMPSAPAGSAASEAACTERFRVGLMLRRSSPARCPRERLTARDVDAERSSPARCPRERLTARAVDDAGRSSPA